MLGHNAYSYSKRNSLFMESPVRMIDIGEKAVAHVDDPAPII